MDKIQLFTLILLKIDENNPSELTIQQVEKLIDSLLNIYNQDQNTKISSHLASYLLQDQNSISLPQLIRKLSDQMIYINKMLKEYFKSKFFNTKLPLIPKLQQKSMVIQQRQLVYFVLANQTFSNVDNLSLLYSFSGSGTSFNRIVHSILGYDAPIIILIKHYNKEEQKEYTFGAYQHTKLEDHLGYQGSVEGYLFSLSPIFHNFYTFKGKGGNNYSYMNSKKLNKSKYKVGLGFGGDDNFSNFKLWIDDDTESESYIKYDDQTYEYGNLAGENDEKLNIQSLEIWGLGGQLALSKQQQYRYEEQLRVEKARKVDKQQFMNGFDAGMILGKTFAHRDQINGDLEEMKK